MKLFRNAVKLGLIGGILTLLIGANPLEASASGTVLLDTATGNNYVNLVYPHYGFTPTTSGTLEAMDIVFSTKDTSVDFVATIENGLTQPLDCVSDPILGTSGNPLAENSVVTHVSGFHGTGCGLVAGNLYKINFGALVVFGGVWGDSNTAGGYGIYYGSLPPTCTDAIQNQNETGVDTGGVCDTSNALVDNFTGKDFNHEIAPHWAFTPEKSGTLTSITGYFSNTQSGIVNSGAHLEDENGVSLDCNATENINFNKLGSHSILNGWDNFTGSGCMLTAGITYKINLDVTQTGGVWVSDSIGVSPIVLYKGMTCSDEVKNQNETGVDVGGVCGGGGLTHNPVLIIPGVLGTDIIKGGDKLWLDLLHNLTDPGDQFMDPLQFNSDLTPSDKSLITGEVVSKEGLQVFSFDYTFGLVQELKNEGYVDGVDLFLFPYDWRYGVTGLIDGTTNTTVDLLKQRIQEIRTQTGSAEVDVVAHSTGGLLTKKYVIDHQLDNHIAKAVFVGVPNTGAPKAVKALVQGDRFGVPLLADSEMKKIAKNLPVVYDLLPSQEYFNNKGSYLKIINQGFTNLESSSQDLDFNQVSLFLVNDHNLNNQALASSNNLHTSYFDNFDMRTAGVDLYSINGCRAGTISKVIERRIQPLLGGSIVSYDQPEESPGDGTVPLESSTNLPINSENKYYGLRASHGEMLSQNGIRQEIVNLITGGNLNVGTNLVTQDISQCKLNGKAVSIFSPLDIDIVDQDGNHSGLVSGGIENNIPNADFEIMGEHKFVYLPTDEGQTYSISLKGTGNGTFTLKSTNIVNNQSTQTATYKDIPVTTSLKGSFDLTNSTKLLLDNNGDNVIDNQLIGKMGEVVTLPKYIFPGFLQPINDTGHQVGVSASVFKAGSTVPVKFQLKKLDGTYTQATSLPVWLTPQKGSAMNLPVGESVYTDTATPGSTFKLDGQQYTYNWSTKGLAAGYWYKISVKLDDGYVYSVNIGLK